MLIASCWHKKSCVCVCVCVCMCGGEGIKINDMSQRNDGEERAGTCMREGMG